MYHLIKCYMQPVLVRGSSMFYQDLHSPPPPDAQATRQVGVRHKGLMYLQCKAVPISIG